MVCFSIINSSWDNTSQTHLSSHAIRRAITEVQKEIGKIVRYLVFFTRRVISWKPMSLIYKACLDFMSANFRK